MAEERETSDTATIMAALSATAVALTARWDIRIMSPGWLGLRAAQSCPVIAPQRKSRRRANPSQSGLGLRRANWPL